MQSTHVKFKLGALGLLLLCVVALVVLACKTDASSEAAKEWTVTIDVNGGNALANNQIKVTDGQSFTLDPAPTHPKKYFGVKDYLNTDDGNSAFIMGQTKVTKDITLKIEWAIDLNLVRDLMIAGNGLWSDTVNGSYTFTKVTDNPIQINSSFFNPVFQQSFPGVSTITASDRADMIAKFSPNLSDDILDYLKDINDSTITLYSSKYQREGVFTK